MVDRISREELCADIQRVGDETGGRPTEDAYRKRGEHSAQTVYDRFGSWNAALEAAGYPSRTTTTPTDTELREELQALAERLDASPTAADMNAFGQYWGSQYRDRFGSWDDALDAVGLEPPADLPHTPAALEESLRDLADDPESADPPTKHDMAARGLYHPRVYIQEYGTWEGALRAAGLEVRGGDPEWALRAELQRLEGCLDARPSGVMMNAYGAYQRSTYRERFGSWSGALEAVELDPEASYPRTYSDEALLADLRAFADDLGHAPTTREMETDGPYSATTYQRRFGSWNAAVEAAGLEPESHDLDPPGKLSEETLVANMQAFADELGHAPTAREMNTEGPHSKATYQKRFGSWSAALEAAELPAAVEDREWDQDEGPNTRLTRAELRTAIESLAEELGRPPMAKEMQADGPYSEEIYRRRFGSWSEALAAAGIASDHNSTKLSESVLLRHLRAFADELGKRPTAREMNTDGPYATSTYQNRFGSWSEAADAALKDWSPPTDEE